MLASCLGLVGSYGGHAAAQGIPDDPEILSVGRALADAGYDHFRAGRWDEANRALDQAYRLVPAPTVALLNGQAVEQLGRLRAARDWYRRARDFPLDSESSHAFVTAVEEARARLAHVDERIPLLMIHVDGMRDEEHITLRAGETSVRPGRYLALDPGQHLVTLEDTEGDVHQVVELEPGDRKVLTLTAPAEARRVSRNEGKASARASADAASAAGRRNGIAGDDVRRERLRRAGWGSIAGGAVALGMGAGSGLLMRDRKRTLDAQCRPICPEDVRDERSELRTARKVSIAGYAIGLAGVGAGAVLVTVGGSDEPARPAVELETSAGMLRVRRWF